MDTKKEKVLIVGALGQVGRELCINLQQIYGYDNVIATDIKTDPTFECRQQVLDVMNRTELGDFIKKEGITQVYLLAALLSATAEKNPDYAWRLNMEGLFNVLDLAKEKVINKVYWPSSIAVFGPNTPKWDTPQNTVIEPNTVYGIGKLAGERWCEYYNQKHGVDVRSLRYPGLIGYKSAPGGGTTDYAVHIFHEALKNGAYTCFLSAETALPMMYMPDAIRATLEIMHAPAEQIKIRSSYNLAGCTFTPTEIANEIKKHISDFKISYDPDFRQKIADSWPASIDDTSARADWGWKHEFGLSEMVKDMLANIR